MAGGSTQGVWRIRPRPIAERLPSTSAAAGGVALSLRSGADTEAVARFLA